MSTAEEYAALLEALAEAKKGREDLVGELRVVRTERDLLKEQLNKFRRQLFSAKSEASATHQKDMFFNEAEVLGAQAQSAVGRCGRRPRHGQRAGTQAHREARPQTAGPQPTAPRGAA